MPRLKVSVLIELDGQKIANSPLVYRYNVAENSGPGLTLIATPDNGSVTYHPVAAATMPAMTAFIATTDQPINFKINVNTPVPLSPPGIIMILGTNLVQGTPNLNIQYNNPALTGGANATLSIIAAGT